ncbi:MAG TPA: amidohydrolase [Bacteroidetes bacterium]|nr:amidohydrolase [Bacteroidota bacterium]HRK03826.1 M20 family metallopeptidase [Chlorobiota bacterium]
MTSDSIVAATSIADTLITTRRHIHAHPELSFQEFETNAYIRARLTELGIQHRTVAGTGVIGIIGSGERCIALRADIDALPITEETGLDFASTRPGVMHACGHDTHTTMLLGAAEILKQQETSLGGRVLLIFQPGEEKSPGGASMIIDEGVFEEYAPSMIFGQHIDPDAPAGTLSFVAGPMMAAADEIYITIDGFGAHAAQPHKGKDPIYCAAGLIMHLQQLLVRQRNPLLPGVLTIASIHGGTATNIIPDRVELKGTLRAFDQSWRESAWSWLEHQVPAYAQLHGCTATLSIVKGYPPLVNNTHAVDLARSVAVDTFGPSRVADFEPKMWAEDFSFYSHRIPACFWMLGGRPQNLDSMPGLHHPRFAPDESAMVTGCAQLVAVAKAALHEA